MPSVQHPPSPTPSLHVPDDTLDLTAQLAGLRSLLTDERTPPGTGERTPTDIAGWTAAETPAGRFTLAPVRAVEDLPLLHRWMNDPAVAAFWELAGPPETTAAHLRAQREGTRLDGGPHSEPCLGLLDGTPMSYWELYRADADPLAGHYAARPHDTGLHLLIGGGADRGRGLGSMLLRAVCDLVLAHRPACERIVAEPDVRNAPSIAAFLNAGFHYAEELDLPDKRAALMVRERALGHL